MKITKSPYGFCNSETTFLITFQDAEQTGCKASETIEQQIIELGSNNQKGNEENGHWGP